MSLKIFIGRDIQDETQLPGTPHESRTIRELCYYLVQTWFHDHSRHYALIAGPLRTHSYREIAPDLVIISQLGVGVIELKDYPGRIDCRHKDGAWIAGNKVMFSGSAANPFQQVVAYAAEIKQELINEMWLPGFSSEWGEMKLQTAVCFTHPRANISGCERHMDQYQQDAQLRAVGGPFAVKLPQQIAAWAEDLRFGKGMGINFQNRPLQWTPEQVENVAVNFFAAREWDAINRWMASVARQPYGYLTLLDGRHPPAVFSLRRIQATIGREPSNDVIVPPSFPSVGRLHAYLRYVWLDTVEIAPAGSDYGVWVNGERTKQRQLEDGDELELKPVNASEVGCRLRFTLTQPPAAPTVS